MIQEIVVNVSFEKHTLTKKDSGVVEGDYNTTKLIFVFEEDVSNQRIVFKMSNPQGELVLLRDLDSNHEVMLTGYTEDGSVCSLFNEPGLYPFELVLYGDDSKLTSAPGWLNVNKRLVEVDGATIEEYFAVFGEVVAALSSVVSVEDDGGITIDDYLQELDAQRDNLADNIAQKGGVASKNEKLNTLVPKILSLPSNGEASKEWNDFMLSGFGANWGERLFSTDIAGTPYDLDKLPPIDTSSVTDFSYIFIYCWGLTKAPDWDTSNGTNFQCMFQSCPLTKFPNYDFSKATNMDYTFSGSKFSTVPVIDTSKCTSFYNTFEGNYDLVTIEGIDFSSCTGNLDPFNYCSNLTNLTVNGTIKAGVWWYYNSNLSRESLLSIINALYDYSGTTTTKEFGIPQDAFNRLTKDDIAIATAKGWSVGVA